MKTIVRTTKQDDSGDYRVRDAYFPALPESFEEYVKRRYGSWSKYEKYKDELRAREATEWLACYQTNKKRNVSRTADYEVYGAFSLICKVRPLTHLECEELLAAYKKALDHQDDIRVEFNVVKAQLSKVVKGDLRYTIERYNKLSIDKGKS